MSFRLILLTIIIVLTAIPVFGSVKTTKNLGMVGETYPIAEPDILAELKENARQHQPTREEMEERAKTYQPHNLKRLPRATEDRTQLVDMTYTLKKDIPGGEGKVLYPKGFTFNPLEYIPFTGGMVVLDPTDPKQIKWFKESPYFDNHLARLFITDGYAYTLVDEFKRPVFYMTRLIATRLHITAVPAVIIPKNNKMLVRTIGDWD